MNDRLPSRVRSELQDYDSHGLMADGSQLPFYGKLELKCCLRSVPVEITSIVSKLKEDAILGMPEVKVGIPSVIEAALLPQLIGWGKTRLLCYTGENITAEKALNWGLVEKIVPGNKLGEAVEEWVNAILEAGPKAIRLQKELLGYWEKMAVSDGIQEGIRSIGNAYETDEPFRILSVHIKKLQKR